MCGERSEKMEKELRYIPVDEWLKREVRSEGEGEDKKAVGVGIIYDEWTEIYPGFKERIVKGAVKNDKTVKSFINHDPSMVLATTKSKPALELNDTDKGVEYASPIPPTSYGKDLIVNLERGNIKGSSFAFSVPEDGQKTWEEDGVFYRDIKKLKLYEIGPVVDPAYVQTSAQLRSAEDVYKELRDAKSQLAEAEAQEQVKEEERRKVSQAAEQREREIKLLETEVTL